MNLKLESVSSGQNQRFETTRNLKEATQTEMTVADDNSVSTGRIIQPIYSLLQQRGQFKSPIKAKGQREYIPSNGIVKLRKKGVGKQKQAKKIGFEIQSQVALVSDNDIDMFVFDDQASLTQLPISQQSIADKKRPQSNVGFQTGAMSILEL